MKQLLHVFHAGPIRFDVRMTFLGRRFRSVETFDMPAEAAFWADCMKQIVSERYSIKTVATLPPETFLKFAARFNVNDMDITKMFHSIPDSFRSFLYSYHEVLNDFSASQRFVSTSVQQMKALAKSAAKAKAQAKWRAKQKGYVAEAQALYAAQQEKGQQ